MKYSKLDLGQIEALVNRLGGMDGVMSVISGQCSLTKNPMTSLGFLRTADTPTTPQFLVRKKIAVGKANISHICREFKRWMFDKVENGESATTLRVLTVKKEARAQVFVSELGERNCETSLAHMLWLMEQQPDHVHEGPLNTDGMANVFFVRDVGGVLREVLLFQSQASWVIQARVIGDGTYGADGVVRIFSR